ncbi:outer membrane lipoprotein chaperone LolA [Shewanella maritima]|uniref:outer membrane lipoprotein chaperone LolA n=1 Tax=Shewanella maritima TaxID=2520507 RepID=UPI003735793B
MYKLVSSLLLSTSVLLSAPTFAQDSDALRTKLANIDSLHATFTQQVTDINDRVIQSGNGVFALAQPNQFYWHLTEPDESLIVADGTNLWIYNPFAEEVTVMDIAQAIDASPMALLVHKDEQTWSQYNVTQSVNPEPALQCFDINPKDLDANVVKVSVCFAQDILTQFSLLDGQGNLSEFALTQQRSVTQEEYSIFSFALPDNVDIDDQRLKQPQ